MTDLLKKLGVAFSTGATCAGTALVAGQAGPQALLPEEIITVPGSFIACAAAGYMGADHMVEVAKVTKEAADAEEAARLAAEEFAKQETLRIAAEKAAEEFAKQEALRIAAEKAAKEIAEKMAKQTCSLNNFHVNGTKIVKEVVLKGECSVPVVDYSDVFSQPAVVTVDVCTSADEATEKAIEKAVELAETQRLATEAAQKAAELANNQKLAAEAAKKAAEEAYAKLGAFDKGLVYVSSGYNGVMSYINPVKDFVAANYNQYAAPVVTNIPFVGSYVNDALKYVGNNNLASAMGAYKAYSAYRAIRSDMSVGRKVMAVAEIALPFAARPLAEVVVNATGVQTSVELVTAGITLAPTGLRVAAGVVNGTARALTFAYNKCCGRGKVAKEAGVETPVNETPVIETPVIETPVGDNQQPLQIPQIPVEVKDVIASRSRSNSQEKLLKAAQNFTNAMNDVVAVVNPSVQRTNSMFGPNGF